MQTVQASRCITLFLWGDVMTGRGIDQILPHAGKPDLFEPLVRSALDYVQLAETTSGPIRRPVDFAYIWGDARDTLRRVAPDLRIINLETAVTTSDHAWHDKAIHYRMHPDNLPCLTAVGINCCALANNHVMDWGYRGLKETLASLHRAGVATAGAGLDAAEAVTATQTRHFRANSAPESGVRWLMATLNRDGRRFGTQVARLTEQDLLLHWRPPD